MLLMPIAHTIHYKSAFDITGVGFSGLAKIRNDVRSWLKSHNITRSSAWRLDQSWFDVGDTEQMAIGQGWIRVAVNKGTLTTINPENWAIEFIHSDSEFPSRLWCTEIGLSKIDDNSIRFACMLKHAVYEGWIGDFPPPPHFSVPKLIRQIISQYTCCKVLTKLQSSTAESVITDVGVLEKAITDKTRVLPIIVSVCNENCTDPVDTSKLLNIVMGNANVYKLTTEMASEFNSLIPEKLLVKPGMVRVYSKYTSLDSNSRRHRYYTKYKISEIGSDVLLEQIGIALARNSKTFTASEIIRVKDVINARTYHRLNELRNSPATTDDDLVKLLQEELEGMEKKHEEAKKEADDYASDYDELEKELNEAKAKIYRLEHGVQQQQSDLELDKLSELPTDVCGCMRVISDIFSDKIIIHEHAYDTASNFSGNDSTNCIRCAWRMLYATATTLFNIVFVENCNNIEAEFRNRTGIDFSMNEGKQTKKDKNLMRLRCCEYKGVKYEFLPHMKGKRNEDFLRIHIAFAKAEKRILVCHCGEHIETYGTQRMS